METNKIIQWWDRTIEKINKYFPKSICEYITEADNDPYVKEHTYVTFVTSKQWALDMCKTVFCNQNKGTKVSLFHPILDFGTTRSRETNVYTVGNTTYSIGCKRYLNGNLRISIEKEIRK